MDLQVKKVDLSSSSVSEKKSTQVIEYFQDLKNTHFNGRYYTRETLKMFNLSKTLGVDLKGLGLYPQGFNPDEIVDVFFNEIDELED